MSIPGPEDLYVCPCCLRPLNLDGDAAVCTACQIVFLRQPDGFFDLTPGGSRYKDWLSVGEEARRLWLEGPARTEAAGAEHMVKSYLLPLLRGLRLASGARVLSVGCGGGWDVEALHQVGFLAWGIDNGGRTAAWRERDCLQYLSLSDAMAMPFLDAAFDFVFSEGVIEHIGYEGDSGRRHPGWECHRQRFAESLLRVTKPGGYVLVTCPNRLFPIDFFHGGRSLPAGLRLRLHSPSEEFLLSYSDIKDLFAAESASIRPLSLRGFFNLSRLATESRLLALPVALVDHIMRFLPARFWGTALSPYLVVLIRKAASPEPPAR